MQTINNNNSSRQTWLKRPCYNLIWALKARVGDIFFIWSGPTHGHCRITHWYSWKHSPLRLMPPSHLNGQTPSLTTYCLGFQWYYYVWSISLTFEDTCWKMQVMNTEYSQKALFISAVEHTWAFRQLTWWHYSVAFCIRLSNKDFRTLHYACKHTHKMCAVFSFGNFIHISLLP